MVAAEEAGAPKENPPLDAVAGVPNPDNAVEKYMAFQKFR